MALSLDSDLPQRLSQRLQGDLSGAAAQRRFSPQLSYGRQFGPCAHDARRAAVVVLLYGESGEWRIVMTLRQDHLPEHAGQICFPGGVAEEGESSQQAALRELEEELGVSASEVQILGELSPVNVFVSNYLVTPWLAVVGARPRFCPNLDEVAEVVEAPLTGLLDERNYGRHVVRRRGPSFEAPHIAFESHCVWGATSMILGELIVLLNETPAL